MFKQLICSLILIECIHSMYKCHHKYFLYLMKVKVLFIWTYEVIIIFLTPGSEKSIKKIQSHKEKQSTPFYPSFVESLYVRFKWFIIFLNTYIYRCALCIHVKLSLWFHKLFNQHSFQKSKILYSIQENCLFLKWVHNVKRKCQLVINYPIL